MYVLSRVGELLEGDAGAEPPVASFYIAVIPSSSGPQPLILQFGGTASPADWEYAWSGSVIKSSADLRWQAGTTNVEIPVASGARQISIFVRALADDLPEGDELLELSLSQTVAGTAIQTAALKIQDQQATLPAGASVIVCADTDAVGEGETASFTLYTQGLPTGTRLAYRVFGVSPSDLDNLPLSGSTAIDSTGMARVLLPIANDKTAEDTEFIALKLTGVSGQSASQLVLDTSTPTVDYSNDPSRPTPVWFTPSASGTTLVLSNTLQGGSDTADYLSFSVPASQKLNRIVMEDYESSDGVAFIALERGKQITASETNPKPLIGYTHFGTRVPGLGRGSDLLSKLGGPLAGGDYSVWVQQAGPLTEYRLRLFTEPAAQGSAVVSGAASDDRLVGSSFSDYIDAAPGDDIILAREGDDTLIGGDGADILVGASGNDRVDGRAGIDTAVFQYNLSSYTIDLLADGSRSVRHNTEGLANRTLPLSEGLDILVNIERLRFADKSIALDADGTAAQAYRIYKAAFDRTPDSGGLGYWVAQMDKGMDLSEVSARFVDSKEFRDLYGTNPTNAQFLSKLYQNVLGRDPEIAGYNWWLNELNTNPSKTKAKVLADFSESGENQTGVASLIGTGISYEPWVG
jgi:hypothetical protein